MTFDNDKTFGEMGVNANPLTWPTGWKRTVYKKKSIFKTGFARARDGLFHELKLMGVSDWNVILSTNVPLRQDGIPYAGMAQPKDTGVAVYFRYKNKPMVFACDQYTKVEDNLYAICKTVEALRGINRWGASEMMERSFTGFLALPAPAAKVPREWWDILECRRDASPEVVRAQYLRLSKDNHPDRGGDENKMAEINHAYYEATK